MVVMRVVLAVLALALLPAAASAKTLITYQREGGLAGIPLSLTCGVKGHCQAIERTDGEAKPFTLSDKELKGLKRSIRKAGFDTLESDYRPTIGTVADGFTETVRYHGKTVVAGTGGDAPPRLTQLLSRLSTLASSQ
jgi:hypothetical protein